MPTMINPSSHLRSLYRSFLRELPPQQPVSAPLEASRLSSSKRNSPPAIARRDHSCGDSSSSTSLHTRLRASFERDRFSTSGRSTSISQLQSQPRHDQHHHRHPDSSHTSSTAVNTNIADTSLEQNTDTVFVGRQIQQAQQYLLYLQSQRMYTTLLERYNPGLVETAGPRSTSTSTHLASARTDVGGGGIIDRGQSATGEAGEMVRLTARRVGMEMPREWYGGEKQGTENERKKRKQGNSDED